MNTKIREIQQNEIKNQQILQVTPLFFISQGSLFNQNVVIYKLRSLQRGAKLLEDIIQKSNTLWKFESSQFLQRLGYINNINDNSLSIVYNMPISGYILSEEFFFNQTIDLNRKLKTLNNMFHIVAKIKKGDETADIGCIVPYVFFSFYDTEKELYLVDYIFAELFQKTNQPIIRMMSGFFNSNDSDEIAISCLLTAFAFMDNFKCKLNYIQILSYYSMLVDQRNEEEIINMKDKNGKSLIENQIIRTFIKNVFSNKAFNPKYNYSMFYNDFKSFCDEMLKKEKVDDKKSNTTYKEKFYYVMGQKEEKVVELLKKKDQVDMLMQYFFEKKKTNTLLSIDIDHNTLIKELEKEREVNRERAIEKNKSFISNVNEFNKKIKDQLKQRIAELENKPNLRLKDIKALEKQIEAIKLKIETIGEVCKKNLLLDEIKSKSDKFLSDLDIINEQIVPDMFNSFTHNVSNICGEPSNDNMKLSTLPDQLLSNKSNLNYIHTSTIHYKAINTPFYAFVHTGSNEISLFQSNDRVEKSQCTFMNCSINTFLPFCKWITFNSFILVTGGKNEDRTLSNVTLLIDLTKENIIEVYERSSMLKPRRSHSMCKLNNHSIVVVGGENEICEHYSVISNQWTTMPSLPQTRCNGILLLLNETNLYYFGGEEKSNTVDSLLLNKEKEQWITFTLNTEIIITKCATIVLSEKQFILLGGYYGEEDINNYNNKVFIFDMERKNVEEMEDHLITFNIYFKFEENYMVDYNNAFNQIAVNEKEECCLVSLNKKLFNLN